MHESPVCLLDFSGIYETQTFWREVEESERLLINVRDIPGTNCYCDEEATRWLQEIIQKLPLNGIHFLDSGNYHYMTRIWLTRLDQPFRLLVFDHHTDLQPPAFGDLLSCGGWIDSALRELSLLRETVLVGPDEEAYAQVDETLTQRICHLSQERIVRMDEEDWRQFFEQLPMDLPWYLSIDKDVLDPTDARTTWSQGDLRLSRLLTGLEAFRERAFQSGIPVLGIDVCGECDPDRPEGAEVNDRTNRLLLEELKKFYA